MSTTIKSTGPAVVVYGIDSSGKARAAYFKADQAELAVKAAKLMQLKADTIAHARQSAVAAKLPVGKLYSDGRGAVPFVRRDLYAQLLQVMRPADKAQKSTTAAAAARKKDDAVNASATSTSAQKNGSGRRKATVTARQATVTIAENPLPCTFADIAPGHVILAQESLEEGWWEVVVVAREGDALTLKYRDYPRTSAFKRHISTVALMSPAS
jgi:hypothetical protein